MIGFGLIVDLLVFEFIVVEGVIIDFIGLVIICGNLLILFKVKINLVVDV